MDKSAAPSNAHAAAEPRAGRAAMQGALLGFVLIGAGSTWMAYAGDADFGGALGIGAFVGCWGGCGFGGMIGATLCVARAEEREAARAQPVGAPRTDRAPVQPLDRPVKKPRQPTEAAESAASKSLTPIAS